MPNDNGDKKIFAVPDTQGEPALFLGFMYAATRSEDAFEENPTHGPGPPIYSAYIFPYVPSDEKEKEQAEKDNAELPLFVSYVFPFLPPDGVVLGGGGGGHSALGGKGAQVLFLGQVFSFKAGDKETDDSGTGPL